MQLFATSTSPLVTGIGVGTGASAYTALVTQYVSALATGSKATVDDQLNAYQNLQSLIFSDAGGPNGGVLYRTNKNDVQRAADAYENSDISKRIQQVAAQWGDASSVTINPQDDMAQVRATIALSKLNALSRFSQDDQKIILVADEVNVHGALVEGGKDVYYANVADWKAGLKQIAAGPAVSGTTTSSGVIVTADSTNSSGTNGVGSANPGVNATPGLLMKTAPSDAGASVALQVMLRFRSEMEAEKDTALTLSPRPKTSAASTYSDSRTVATASAVPTPASAGNRLDKIA